MDIRIWKTWRTEVRTGQSSIDGGLACFGFLRASFGSIGREGFTVPTRSRASLRTSFFWSNVCFFGMVGYLTHPKGSSLQWIVSHRRRP
jgi:hypothetical protein